MSDRRKTQGKPASEAKKLGQYAVTGGPGRPVGRKNTATIWRERFEAAAKPEDAKVVYDQLKKAVDQGQAWAIALWTDRFMGKPQQPVEIDAGETIDVLLLKLAQADPEGAEGG